jgi:magnesium-transporting ATPase (P-type)
VSRTEPNEILEDLKPSKSLLSPSVLVSLLAQFFMMFAFQISLTILILNQKWYVPLSSSINFVTSDAMIVSTMFLFTNFQYPIVLFGFNVGKPFRKNIFSNCNFFLF